MGDGRALPPTPPHAPTGWLRRPSKRRSKRLPSPSPSTISTSHQPSTISHQPSPTMPFIEGYADKTSVAPGEALGFHVSTDAPAFRILITREGLEGGTVHQVDDVPGGEHPVAPTAYAEGCGWPESCRLEIPSSWRSGVY